jgi:hypothetical protein
MKTKISILIATGLFITAIANAQYGAPCRDGRVVIQAHIGFPLPFPVPVAYNYDYYQAPRERYDDRRNVDYGYNDRRNWRAEQYERYCHENRGYHMSREEYYRDHCDSRVSTYHAPRKVVEYGRY